MIESTFDLLAAMLEMQSERRAEWSRAMRVPDDSDGYQRHLDRLDGEVRGIGAAIKLVNQLHDSMARGRASTGTLYRPGQTVGDAFGVADQLRAENDAREAARKSATDGLMDGDDMLTGAGK